VAKERCRVTCVQPLPPDLEFSHRGGIREGARKSVTSLSQFPSTAAGGAESRNVDGKFGTVLRPTQPDTLGKRTAIMIQARTPSRFANDVNISRTILFAQILLVSSGVRYTEARDRPYLPWGGTPSWLLPACSGDGTRPAGLHYFRLLGPLFDICIRRTDGIERHALFYDHTHLAALVLFQPDVTSCGGCNRRPTCPGASAVRIRRPRWLALSDQPRRCSTRALLHAVLTALGAQLRPPVGSRKAAALRATAVDAASVPLCR